MLEPLKKLKKNRLKSVKKWLGLALCVCLPFASWLVVQ